MIICRIILTSFELDFCCYRCVGLFFFLAVQTFMKRIYFHEVPESGYDTVFIDSIFQCRVIIFLHSSFIILGNAFGI